MQEMSTIQGDSPVPLTSGVRRVPSEITLHVSLDRQSETKFSFGLQNAVSYTPYFPKISNKFAES